MAVRFHPHALERMRQRGALPEEVAETVEKGESFPAKFDRTGFRRNFGFQGLWRERAYSNKQIEAYAVPEEQDWIVITVLVKYF